MKLSTKSKKFVPSPRKFRPRLFIIWAAIFGIAGLLVFRLFAATTVTSVKSGNWSDPTVWSTGKLPADGDAVAIAPGTDVKYDLTTGPKIAETTVQGTLTFDPGKSTKYITNRNFVVTGKLVMKPSSPSIEQFIQFVEVDETKFVGGGMNVLASDVGMWVMGDGQLDVAGASKTSWTNLAGAAAQGATSITLKDAPTGWQVGDTIFIAPNEPPTVGDASFKAFDERVITGISGNTVSFSQGLSRPRGLVNGKWTAEVGNLSRNVRIEGTYTFVPAGEADWPDQDRHKGNSHIFIHSTKPQFIANAQLRYMGTMGINEADRNQEKNPKLGRYALHFHHMADSSRGSVVDGVVVRESNYRGYVSHASNGITYKNDIGYKVKGDVYWWDSHDLDPSGPASHDITYDHTIAARWHGRGDDSGTGYFIAEGQNDKILNSVAVGMQFGREKGGFAWFNGDHGAWVFDNNITHNNNDNGIQVWQNSPLLHPTGNFASYYNQTFGIIHGAYANTYMYFNGEIYGNKVGGIKLQANTADLRLLKFENMVWDGAGITPNLIVASESALPPSAPTLIHDNVFKNWTEHAILVEGTGDAADSNPKSLDIVNSTFSGPGVPIFYGSNSGNPNNIVRVQPKGGQAYKITAGNVFTNIANFAPDNYGSGKGLLAEYFIGPNFTNKVFTRLEQTASQRYNEDGIAPPQWISPWPRAFTVRYTGEFQAQYSEPYTFIRDAYSGMRIWVNNQLVVDAWQQTDKEVASAPITLTKDQKYPIKVEVNLPDISDQTRFTRIYNVFMQSAHQTKLILPTSQLYCGTDPACNVNPGTGTSTPSGDTTKPSVSLTSPTTGSTLKGSVSLAATATDNVGVSRVDFLVDGQVKASDTSSPYSATLDTTGLSNSSHTVTAAAYDAAGNSDSSGATVSVNNDTVAPSAAILTPVAGSTLAGIVTVTTSASDNTGLAKVEILRDGVVLGTASASNGNFSLSWDTTVSNEGSHTLAVRATDTSGNVSTSSNVSVTVKNQTPPSDTTAPSSPTNVRSTSATTSSIALAWNASTDNVGVVGYSIYRNGNLVGTTTSTTFIDTGLAAATTFTYTVRASDASGNVSPSSSSVSASTGIPADLIAPSVPGSLASPAQTQTSVNLTWNASSDNIGVTSYDVFRNGTKIASTSVNSFTDSNLTPNMAYSYTVAARDGAGNSSAASSALTVRTQVATDTQKPSAPGSLTATANSSNRITLTWIASTDNVGVVKYVVQRSSSGSFVTIAEPTTAGFIDTTVTPSSSFQYRVFAVDASNLTSDSSGTAQATTPALSDSVAPTQPGSFKASTVSAAQINLEWTQSSDNVAVTGYQISRNGSVIGTTTSGMTASFGDANLNPNTSYTYTIVALDAAGNRSSAASVTASTKTLNQADLNKDGKVDIFDLSILLANWSKTGNNLVGDINGDGKVDVFDLSILLSQWSP